MVPTCLSSASKTLSIATEILTSPVAYFGFTLFIVGDLSCPGSDLESEADSSSFGARAQAVAAGYFRLPSATPFLLSTKSELVLVDGVLAKQHFSFLTSVFFMPWKTFC